MIGAHPENWMRTFFIEIKTIFGIMIITKIKRLVEIVPRTHY